MAATLISAQAVAPLDRVAGEPLTHWLRNHRP